MKLIYKYDVQCLIEAENISEDTIRGYILEHIEGDCLLAVGDETVVKLHYHTNAPWDVLKYCASQGEIYDIVVENMETQVSA